MSDFEQQFDKINSQKGFIAALDQSGGSTPKALKLYGVAEDAWSNDDEMFAVVHQMRTRIITSPSFNGDRILGAILFENTMDRDIEGRPTPDYLWNVKNVVPFLKVDKGLAAEADGVQLMKPMPELDALLARAKPKGIFGTKMRSVIKQASAGGVDAIVKQQFEIGRRILATGLIPIIEPEVDIHCPDKAAAEDLLHKGIADEIARLGADQHIMLKLTLPEKDDLYKDFVDNPKVLRVVALSGGYSRDEANERSGAAARRRGQLLARFVGRFDRAAERRRVRRHAGRFDRQYLRGFDHLARVDDIGGSTLEKRRGGVIGLCALLLILPRWASGLAFAPARAQIVRTCSTVTGMSASTRGPEQPSTTQPTEPTPSPAEATTCGPTGTPSTSFGRRSAVMSRSPPTSSWSARAFEAHRKAGLIVRQSLDEDAPYAHAVVHGDGLTSLQFRRNAGAQTEEVRAEAQGSTRLRLERRGDQFLMYVGEPAGELTGMQAATVKLSDPVYVGLAVCSHNAEALETAIVLKCAPGAGCARAAGRAVSRADLRPGLQDDRDRAHGRATHRGA